MPFYKDYNKDVKDLLTKNYGTAWKIETKFKGAEQTVFINPGATSKGVTVDVQYNMKPFKTVTTVDDKGGVKPKVTYEKDGHKVEAWVDRTKAFEVAYEGKFPGDVMVHDKLTAKAADAYVSAKYQQFSVGGGLCYNIEKSTLKSWGAGLHYADKGIVANLTTEALKTYTTGVLFPLTISGQKFSFAAQTICGHDKFEWAVGTEGDCFLIKGAKFRARIDNTLKVAFAHIDKLSDCWKAATSVEIASKDSVKVGVTFTRE